MELSRGGRVEVVHAWQRGVADPRVDKVISSPSGLATVPGSSSSRISSIQPHLALHRHLRQHQPGERFGDGPDLEDGVGPRRPIAEDPPNAMLHHPDRDAAVSGRHSAAPSQAHRQDRHRAPASGPRPQPVPQPHRTDTARNQPTTTTPASRENEESDSSMNMTIHAPPRQPPGNPIAAYTRTPLPPQQTMETC